MNKWRVPTGIVMTIQGINVKWFGEVTEYEGRNYQEQLNKKPAFQHTHAALPWPKNFAPARY